jgi:DNA ligase-associated metallophosphoesterase
VQGRSVQVQIGREDLTLFPNRAILWPSQKTLLVADLHIGKGAAFRAESVAVPTGSSESTLVRITNLLSETNAKRLIVLGDFWHAKQGRTEKIHQLLKDWRSRHQDTEMILVEGNHDKRSGSLPPDLEMDIVQELLIDGIVLKHHPEPDDRGYVLAGHIHPAVRLVGPGRQTERLPCFWFRPQIGVMPSFGDFTGSATVYPAARDRVFVIAGQDVCEVSLTGVGS